MINEKQTLILITSGYRFSNLERVATHIKYSYDKSIEFIRSHFNIDLELIWAVGLDMANGFGIVDIYSIQSKLNSSGIKSIFISCESTKKYDEGILNAALESGISLTDAKDPYWMCLDDDNIIVPILFPTFAKCINNTDKDILILSMLYEWSITQNMTKWYYNPDAINPDPSRVIMKYSIWKKYGGVHSTDNVYDVTWYRNVVNNELEDNVYFSTDLHNHLVDKISTRHNGLLSESDWNNFDSMMKMPILNSWICVDALDTPECKRHIELPDELVKQIYPIIRQYYKSQPLM